MRIHSNLDIEYLWASHPATYTPRKHALAIRERWAHLLRLVPGYEDAEPWLKGPRPQELLTWGADQGAALELARQVNDKRLSHELSLELGCGLPGAAILESVEALERRARGTRRRWVVKHPLGVSGRERVLGRPGRLEATARAWAARQFERGWTLLWEPWAEVTREWSVHADIEEEGVVWRGGAEIQTDGGGTPRGHIVDPAQTWTPSQEQDAALVALWERGYRGPASVDAWESASRVRPISEINARWTFGRMAWELRRWVPAGWTYVWWHPPRSAAVEAQGLDAIGPQVREIAWYRLPDAIDPGGRSGTLVACAPERAALPQRPPTTDSSSR